MMETSTMINLCLQGTYKIPYFIFILYLLIFCCIGIQDIGFLSYLY